MSRILVVDDEPADLHLIRRALEKQDYEVVTAESAREGLQSLRQQRPDVMVLDVMLPDASGLDLLKKIQEIDERLPVVFVTSSSDSGTAIRAMKLGALDYLVKPIQVAELRQIVSRAVEIRRLHDKPVAMNLDTAAPDSHAIIGRCGAMQDVYKAIGIVAGQDVTVLIRGESGTGKELVARALYQYSDRVQGPFLAVNCAAIPETLLESELFGHERGAFTGADRKRIGKFEQCDGGTLFLDEIGDMSPVLQSKLLRVLQDKRFERVGGNETISTEVRLIAATNRNLEKMVAEEEFRADLYYRLNGFTIHLPPLRQRGEDLDLLVEHFRRQGNRELHKQVREVSPEAYRRLRDYPWPGNIRELQNAIRQALLKTNGPVLLPDFLPDFLRRGGDVSLWPGQVAVEERIERLIEQRVRSDSCQLYDEVVGLVERRLVERLVTHVGGDAGEALRRLGVGSEAIRSSAARRLLELAPRDASGSGVPSLPPGMTLGQIEREAIRQALERSDGCRREAARSLGISVRTMQRRVKELD